VDDEIMLLNHYKLQIFFEINIYFVDVVGYGISRIKTKCVPPSKNHLHDGDDRGPHFVEGKMSDSPLCKQPSIHAKPKKLTA
jgi:hypothetical protein